MKPRIFIGSSVEGKRVADAIQLNLTHDSHPTVWDQMVFGLSSYPVDALLKAVSENDFGILVLSPDDSAKIRGVGAVVPRGNVLFEAALFIGRYGRDRCFLVQPRDHPAFTLPSDLVGITAATYDESLYLTNPSSAVGPACTQIRAAIAASASFQRAVDVLPKMDLADPSTSPLTYPKKLAFQVTNSSSSPVVIISQKFAMGARLRGDPSRSVGGQNSFKVEFFAYTNSLGKDVYQPEVLLRPGGSAKAWVAMERATDDAAARAALADSEVGVWHYKCHWLDEPMAARQFQTRF